MEVDALLARVYPRFRNRDSVMLRPYANLEQQFCLRPHEVPLMRELLNQMRSEAEYMWCLVEQSQLNVPELATIQVYGAGFPLGPLLEEIHLRRLRHGLFDIPWAWVLWNFNVFPTHLSRLQDFIHDSNRLEIISAAEYDYRFWVQQQGFPTDERKEGAGPSVLMNQVARGSSATNTLGPGQGSALGKFSFAGSSSAKWGASSKTHSANGYRSE